MFNKIIKGEETCFEQIAWAPLGEAGEKHGIKTLIKQNHSQTTYTKLLKKEDGFIEFENLKLALSKVEGLKISNSPEKLFNLFRGLYPWPGLWSLVPIRPTRSAMAQQKRLKIIDLELINNKLAIKKVQLEGKREVDFKTFNQAYRIF